MTDRVNASAIDDDLLDALYAERDRMRRLLNRAEIILDATHGHAGHGRAGLHDDLGENYTCAGCELRDAIRDGQPSAERPPVLRAVPAPKETR